MASPGKHGKNATTGKGPVSTAPMSGAKGPSNHVPTIGKATPKEPSSNYSSEQQQRGST